MPTYGTERRWDPWNGDHIAVTKTPTLGEVATNGIALGATLWVRASQNSAFKAAIAAAQVAQDYLTKGEYKQASASAQTLIEMSDPEAKMLGYYFKSSAYFWLGQYDQAISACTRTLELAHSTDTVSIVSDAYIIRGRTYLAKAELAAAMSDFTAFVRLEPSEDRGYFWLSYSLSELGDFEQALSNIDRAVSLNPSSSVNYRERAYIHSQNKNYTKAIEDLTRCIKLAPNNADYYKRRATAFEATGETDLAIADITHAIELSPRTIDYYQHRRRLYELTGDSVHAADDSKIINEEEPVQASYQRYLESAVVAYDQGNSTVYTQSDTVVSPAWGGAIAQIVILLVVGLCTLTFCANFSIQARQSPIGLVLLGLGVITALIVGAIKGTRTQAERKAKAASEYLRMVAENSTDLPGFEDFFQQYLQARKESRLHELQTRTRPFFESGPGSEVVEQHVTRR